MVDVAHDGHHRRAGTQVLLALFLFLFEVLRLELGFLLLAPVDQADLRADLGREQLDHVVAERLGGGDHLALEEQEPDHVPGRTVELGPELARRGAPLDDHLEVGHRRVRRRVGGQLGRLELLEVPTTTARSALGRTAPPAGPTSQPGRGRAATTGTTAEAAATTGTTAEAAATAGTAAARGSAAGTAATHRRDGRRAPGARPGAGHRPGRAARGRRDRSAVGTGRAGRRRDRSARRAHGRTDPGRRLGTAERGRDGGAPRSGGAAGADAATAGGAGRGGAGAGRAGGAGAGRRRRGRGGAAPGAAPRSRWRDGWSRASGGRGWARPRVRWRGPDRSAAGAPARGGRRRRRGRIGPGRGGDGLVGRDPSGPRRGGPGRLLLGGLLGRHGATQSLAVGLPPDAVGLGVLDRGRVALYPDAQRHAEVEGLLVRQAELTCQLVDAYLLRQGLLRSFLFVRGRAGDPARPTILAHLGTGLARRHATSQQLTEALRPLSGTTSARSARPNA